MLTGEPSRTALTAAAARAAHPLVDREPLIFVDDLAARILGGKAEELLHYHRVSGEHPVLAGARAQAVCRSRYTEDRLAEAVRRGVDQYVLLGAGLDTFAYRSKAGIRVFEVDHPATQRWKRGQLAEAGIPVPDTVSFVPVDFETGALAGRLAESGFDASRPAVISWLGVLMYLTTEAIGATLDVLAGFAPGTELIADYMLPAGVRDADGDAYVELVRPVAEQGGEPWRTFLAPEEMALLLGKHGFAVVEQLRQREQAVEWERADVLRPIDLSVVVSAVLG